MNTIKAVIWGMALVGLAPAILLAVLNLGSNIALDRHLKNNADLQPDEYQVMPSRGYMEFGKRHRLEVTTSYWPSGILLLGAGAFVVGLLYLIPSQTQFREVKGFDKIEQYVEQVMKSDSPLAYLVISLADDEYTALSISNDEEGHSLDFSLTKKEQIAPVLAFFSERGIEPASDYVTEEGTEFETRHLSYRVDGTTDEVAEICKSVLVDAYGIEEDAELLFTVSEGPYVLLLLELESGDSDVSMNSKGECYHVICFSGK